MLPSSTPLSQEGDEYYRFVSLRDRVCLIVITTLTFSSHPTLALELELVYRVAAHITGRSNLTHELVCTI
jgi:hypothetical protein